MTVVNEWVAGTRLGSWVQQCRESRRLVLVIVAIALLLDNMLLTTVGMSINVNQCFASINNLKVIKLTYHNHKYA